MNKSIATVGMILLLIAAFFFYVVFNGGNIGPYAVTGGTSIFNFAAFVFVIVFLPIGSGLAYIGFSYRKPAYSVKSSGSIISAVSGSRSSSALGKAILAVAIIAVIVAALTLAAVVAVDGSLSGISSKTAISTVTVAGPATTVTSTVHQGGGVVAAVNATPSQRFLRVDWCNTDNTGQDRYCPSQIVVNQGDTVIILFEHNDTDAHTFTLLPLGTAGYDFQINATFGLPGYTKINGTFLSNGMHNFVTNGNFSSSCTNVPSSSLSQQTAGISTTLCVSGSSLLPVSPGIAVVNPTPGIPLNASAPNGGLLAIDDSNTVVFQEPGGNMSIAYANGAGLSCTAAACSNDDGTGLPAGGQTWGIAAFQATSPGIFEYFCHYHVSNGMFGYITVLPNAYCTANPSGCGIAGSSGTTSTTTT